MSPTGIRQFKPSKGALKNWGWKEPLEKIGVPLGKSPSATAPFDEVREWKKGRNGKKRRRRGIGAQKYLG